MKKNPLLILTLSLCLLLTTSFLNVNSEKINFGVYHGNQKIGTMYINKIPEGKKTSYSLHSEVTISLLMDFKIVEQISDLFEDGILKTSYHTRHVNNMLKVKNTASKSANTYVLTKDGKHAKTMKELITETVVTVYFKEPHDQLRIYSQNFQQMLVLKKTATNAYQMLLPDGNSTTFEYLNGKLRSVISNTTWGHVKFVREN